ncbi:thioredoxin [Methanolobus sp. ZRKC3]|uniref:thioredoxin n=1 Tax=Methanolobus sp. ZRKC3 TaxID=3125786 RepID=UPI0032486196
MDEIEQIRQKRTESLKKKLETHNYPASPVTVTNATFDSLVSQYPLFLIDCWAEWCGPCRMLSPVIDELATELQGKVVFGKLNVDHNRMISSRFAISSIPAMLIFKDGKLVDQITGAVPRQNIMGKLQPLM